jgi:hypothetical protein
MADTASAVHFHLRYIENMSSWSCDVCLSVVTYPGFAWLIRRVSDFMIEFIGPWYNCRRSLSDTLSSSSYWSLHGNYSDFQLNCLLLLGSRYIASGRTTAQKTHALRSNGYMRTHIENTSCDTGSVVTCVYCGFCLEVGLLYRWLFVAGLFT